MQLLPNDDVQCLGYLVLLGISLLVLYLGQDWEGKAAKKRNSRK